MKFNSPPASVLTGYVSLMSQVFPESLLCAGAATLGVSSLLNLTLQCPQKTCQGHWVEMCDNTPEKGTGSLGIENGGTGVCLTRQSGSTSWRKGHLTCEWSGGAHQLAPELGGLKPEGRTQLTLQIQGPREGQSAIRREPREAGATPHQASDPMEPPCLILAAFKQLRHPRWVSPKDTTCFTSE